MQATLEVKRNAEVLKKLWATPGCGVKKQKAIEVRLVALWGSEMYSAAKERAEYSLWYQREVSQGTTETSGKMEYDEAVDWFRMDVPLRFDGKGVAY